MKRYTQEIWDPESIKQVPRSCFFLPMVLPQIDEIEDIRVPWLDVDSESARPLVTALVYVSSGCVIGAKHRDNTVRVSVGARDIGTTAEIIRIIRTETAATANIPCRANTMNAKPDSASCLADHRTVLECVIDPFDRIILHTHQEAAAQLRVWCTCIKQRRRRMREITLRHEIIGVDDPINVSPVDAYCNTHDHMLRTLGNAAINTKEIRSFECLETKAEDPGEYVCVCEQ